MHVKKKKQRGWVVSVTVGSGIAIVTTLALLVIHSVLVINGSVGESSCETIMYIIKMVAIVAGAEAAKRVHGNHDIRICVTVAGAYFAVTVLIGLLVDGRFANLWYHLLVICIGMIISCALCIFNTGRNEKRKKALW